MVLKLRFHDFLEARQLLEGGRMRRYEPPSTTIERDVLSSKPCAECGSYRHEACAKPEGE